MLQQRVTESGLLKMTKMLQAAKYAAETKVTRKHIDENKICFAAISGAACANADGMARLLTQPQPT